MIRRIEALNFRCLRYVDVRFESSFHILVGPNASGKSTLLDVIGFLGDLIRDGLDAAVDQRTRNFQDLVWNRPKKNPGFELAVEFDIPEAFACKLPEKEDFRTFRYEIAIREGIDGLGIASEGGFLGARWRPIPEEHPSLVEEPFSLTRNFPSSRPTPKSILTNADGYGYRPVLQKSAKGTDTFRKEVLEHYANSSGAGMSFTFGPRRSTLKNLPEDSEQFPVATHVKRVLESGVQELFLDSRRLRRASSPNSRRLGFVPDGSNLPWAIKRLGKVDPATYKEWLDHVGTALREIEHIRVVEREDDRHAYLMLRYATGVEVPSWAVSDGTLRLLALTLAAYLPEKDKVYLLEEPENGIHPMAVETIYQSLSSVYDSQVLIATHSPVFLGCAQPKEILCFAKNDAGATDIIAGHRHPRLAHWRSSADVDLLFASEVFG